LQTKIFDLSFYNYTNVDTHIPRVRHSKSARK